MSPDRWQQIEGVFQHAIDLPTIDRIRYLETACAGDDDLRAEVESLLASEGIGHVGSAIEEAAASVSTFGSLEGQRVGAYQILSIIGEGGMGTVYKAVRADGQFDQEVAIKIIRPGAASSVHARRFLEERSMLAQLQHPFIARLIDGGEHSGIPYLVMELIDGKPIDSYCKQFALTIREKLDLFIQVCEAVQHAHAALIVHRDLKPSNILVNVEGVPKLLDFGIAKLVVEDRETTQTGFMLMTPDYASPEQVRGELITVASDVYSLGIVLYELLSGERPYKLKNYSPVEIQKVVCTTEITPPSHHLPDEPKLRKQLEGDLDNIVLMALRKEPGRRYGSVAQFAEDIRRHMGGETVIARPDTFTYRWSKYARRNRLPLSLAAMMILAILAGSFFTIREGLRAQRRFDEVRSLANSLLNDIEPEAAKLIGSAKMRRLLTEKSLSYLDRLAAESGNDISLRKELARAYHKVGDIQGHGRSDSLGLFNESLESHTKGIAIEEPLAKQFPGDMELKRSLALGYAHTGDLHSRRGDAKRAEALIQKAYLLADPKDPTPYIDVRVSMNRIWFLEGRFEDAIRVADEAIPVARLLPNKARLINLYSFKSDVFLYMGEIRRSLENIQIAFDLITDKSRRAELSNDEEVRLANVLCNYGQSLFMIDQPSDLDPCAAMTRFEKASRIYERFLRIAGRSVNLLVTGTTALNALSSAQAFCGHKDSIRTAERAIQLYGAGSQPSNPNNALSLGVAQLQAGLLDDAARSFDTITATDWTATEYLAEIELKRRNPQKAVQLFAKARKLREPDLNLPSYRQRFEKYRQANNILRAIAAGDSTPALRDQAREFMKVFPATGAGAAVEKLRAALR